MRAVWAVGITVGLVLMAAFWLAPSVCGQPTSAEADTGPPLIGSGIPRYEIVEAQGMFAAVSKHEVLRKRWLLLDNQTGRIWLWQVNPATGQRRQQEGWRLCHVQGITDDVPFEP